MQFNIEAEIDKPATDAAVDALMDALAPYHPAATGRAGDSRIAVVITVPAESLTQAFLTGIAVIERAADAPVLSIEVLPTAEFDRRNGVDPLPELVSVTEASEILGITRQALLQQMRSFVTAQQAGATWVLSRAEVEARAAKRGYHADLGMTYEAKLPQS